MRMRLGALALLMGLVAGGAASVIAAPLDGERQILLKTNDGDLLPVGSIQFDQAGDGVSYKVRWDDSQFTDQFLSMRPFKCLEGADKMWCRVPYPYENKREISDKDWVDLEYDLMFVWKNRNDYGIDMWNGVYYRLSPAADGFSGAIYELDLDQLSAPPDDGNLRPIREADLTEGEPESHWLPYLVIE